MFKKLTEFGYVRSYKEALGFYLAWLFTTIFAAAIIGATAGVLFKGLDAGIFESYDLGVKIGATVAILACTTFSVLICKAKGRLGDFSSIILILCTAFLALFLGGILGLLIPSYLTTIPQKK